MVSRYSDGVIKDAERLVIVKSKFGNPIKEFLTRTEHKFKPICDSQTSVKRLSSLPQALIIKSAGMIL